MQIEVDPSALQRTEWHEYLVRFVVGGLVTAVAGIIAKQFGPVIAGLFLAFPAIFPAGATLIEKHEKLKKQDAGFDGIARGRSIASVDAAGAAMGSVGLIAFALVVWWLLPRNSAWIILPIAGIGWLV